MPLLFAETGRPEALRIWARFFILMGLNALLAWGPWTVWQRFWLFPLGLVLQLALVFFSPAFAKVNPEKPFPSLEMNGRGMVLVLGVLALFLRLYGLVSVPVWPTWDDANYSYFAIGLCEKGSWPLLIGHEKTMPLFTWLQGGFFRVFAPSLYSMWLYPALLSLLAVPLGWWAVRRFFPSSFSFLYAALLALGFWPLYYGKFDAYLGVLQWVVEFLLLGVLGLFLGAPSRLSGRRAFLLGLLVGGSFYASMLFVAPAALVTAGVYLSCRKKPGLGWKVFLAYLFPAVLLSLPMDAAFLKNIAGGHVFTYSVFSRQGTPWDRQGASILSYFTAVFWGPIDRSYWSFAPLWGGFFNPVWDALFFTGLGTWRGFLGKTWRSWWWAALGLLFLPAFFFNTLECFRTDLIMPLCLVPVAGGLGILLSTLLPSARKSLFLLVLALSLGLDSYHLFGVFHQWSANMVPGIHIKSPERYRAFQLLRETEESQGPGFVFSDFVSDAYDQSLLVSTYPFNAARNPRLEPEKASWAAILTDLHYVQTLQERFPRARSEVLSDPAANGPILCLVLVPITSPGEQKIFLKWKEVHQVLQDAYGGMPYVVENPDFTPVLEKLWALYPSCGSDPLLKSWVLEKGLDILLVSSDMTPAQWLLGQPVEAIRSFPFLDRKFAGVYHRLGLALVKEGDFNRAKECFQRTAKFDPKYDLKKFLALCR